jgi:hypothetical protein
MNIGDCLRTFRFKITLTREMAVANELATTPVTVLWHVSASFARVRGNSVFVPVHDPLPYTIPNAVEFLLYNRVREMAVRKQI